MLRTVVEGGCISGNENSVCNPSLQTNRGREALNNINKKYIQYVR